MALRSITALALTALVSTFSACAPAGPAATPDIVISMSTAVAGAGLPAELSFSDRMGTAQVAALPEGLDVAGGAVTSHRAGDVAYSPAERSLVVFLTDGAGEAGSELVDVGRVERGMEDLSDCVRDCPVAVVSAATGSGAR